MSKAKAMAKAKPWKRITVEAHDSLLARNKRLAEALKAFVAAEKQYRDDVISHNPEAYDDPLCEAYDNALAALENKEQADE